MIEFRNLYKIDIMSKNYEKNWNQYQKYNVQAQFF